MWRLVVNLQDIIWIKVGFPYLNAEKWFLVYLNASFSYEILKFTRDGFCFFNKVRP